MKRFFISYSLITFLLLDSVVLFAQHTSSFAKQWKIEDESHALQIIEHADTLELIVPGGLTLWSLNCFWAANDPKHPDELFACSQWRNGVFKNYNTLNLFYVGYGGNDNSTTRFRRYRGEYYGIADDKVKPLLKEYTDAPHLLVPNKWYEIRIRVEKGMTTYAVNGEELFRYSLTGNEGDGHFGLRLLQNHVLFTGLKVSSF